MEIKHGNYKIHLNYREILRLQSLKNEHSQGPELKFVLMRNVKT